MTTRALVTVATVLAVYLEAGSARAEDAATPPAAAAPAAAAPAADEDKFSPAQIKEMVAPIALYPDPLLVQILVAATYPLEVVSADRWMDGHKGLEGEKLFTAVDAEDWDASVKSLVYYPDVLNTMSENLDWTGDLGNAFLSQRTDVFDAVQVLRKDAEKAGTLKTTEQQKVITEEKTNTVIIEPASTDGVVYAPTYNPATVYGTAYAPPPQPYYPAMYTPQSSIFSTGNIVSFGLGALTGGLIASAIDWDDDDDYHYCCNNGGNNKKWSNSGNIYVDKSVNVDRSKRNAGDRQRWEHDPSRRRGVPYRDDATARRYPSKGGVPRDVAQGRRPAKAPKMPTAANVAARDRPGGGKVGGGNLGGGNKSGTKLGGGASAPGGGLKQAGAPASKRPATGQAPKRPTAKPTTREAFKPKSGGFERQASQRGSMSRKNAGAGMHYGGGGGGGGGKRRGGGGGGGKKKGKR